MASKSTASGDMSLFKQVLATASRIVIISGAGISAESGIPTFRGAGGFWRKYESTRLATPEAFRKSPSLVWEFYHYRRELVLSKKPNQAHLSIAEFEKKLGREGEGRKLTILTQNVDGLHHAAGSRNVVEIHGSLFRTRCTSCGDIREDRDSPICEALRDRGAPDLDQDLPEIPVEQLPRCKKPGCNGLLRPHIVWFGENLHEDALDRANEAMEECDLCLVVGTSSVVMPAAWWAPQLAARGVSVAEFNTEKTAVTDEFQSQLFDPPSNDTEKFRSLIRQAKNIVAITGAGISSGVPAYSEAWGHWRNFFGPDLDNDYALENLPFLVWEFTHYRRESILKAGPNAAHKALADYENHLREEGSRRNLTIITTNIDGLHVQAGSKDVIEVCGSLFKTRCLKCGEVCENRKQPIWPSLVGKGDPNGHDYAQVDEEAVPHCQCGGRLRPHIVFQGEDIFKEAVFQAEDAVRAADLCLVIGSSSELQPINEFAPTLAGRGVPVAELNLRNTDMTMYFQFQFKGDCTETLPKIIKPLL